MLSEKMQDALNAQMNWEIYSAHIYLSMAAHFSKEGLSGFSTWMYAQYQEEMFHAMRFFNYINEAGGHAKLGVIDAPQYSWETPLAAFENALEHEQGVTARINALADLAVAERNHAVGIFLQWFITEQVEEEDTVGAIVGKLRMLGDGGGLFMLDRDLGTRVFTPPTNA
ncbi:MAG: ferritin [Pseudodesulfovibrio sp.]|uniref:Ferritin n=1 Tax=Pseudodesulfovibrio aespoeensis (strain ATCC 700646 / DSM 10631 / Aspo-2) TaxID=643562 RepID=E6VW15_PSEA9|nr:MULTISPECIES: ferritin [Pseudodesulfovibrio]MBU4191489.1 ferritin [Pseudomonadota bacterium]ADU62460.1 Ferroxidase [Pseudodesulfovibrio aespoeensis Aspo-2]MBU4379611.1 ferritin [Pseudomonadota bacterium]MBU4476699.1 ferritin [Pseudomonadota bacterium]MBU4515073.1 ferritin [Pseudomonadota bacterium]